ncbi:GNAT family N-acetyltransferase [Pedobacter sp. SD-b]|uniref:GNAT family N-acetyltransferase n=1 Tax=Pedobacter segetis TaxID=2793069 RepID=A0ABS1BLU2_9SPHI|nr:GNAT family N-acetyltransferase [Pedobacter segetis]MBK0383860.1 GNAT family N-acetyltransferase [Pedobacter segetis]
MENTDYSIEQIAPAATLMIRQAELYPLMLLKKLQLENDEEGIHFGLFHKNKLVSVVSCFEGIDKSMQFRKFVTLKEFQHQGFGSALLNYVLAFADEQKTKKIWCNARTTAIGFYQKFGMIETSDRFSKNGIDYVVMQKEL